MSPMSGHVSSDRIGEAAQHGGVDFLREAESRHVAGCDRCRRLYAGYRLTDRLLAAPWRDVKLPPAAVARPSRLGAMAAFVRGLDARSIAPAVAAIGILALIGAALALPQLIPVPPPASTHSPIASVTASPSASAPAVGTVLPYSSGQPPKSPGAQASGPGGPGSSSAQGTTPVPTAGGSAGKTTLAITKVGGLPIAWSPDGAHLLMWGPGSGHALQIRDAAGHLNGTATADAAAWVSSSTIAIATHSPIASPSASPSGPAHRGKGGPGPSSGVNVGGETVSLIGLSGHLVATLPGSYASGGGLAGGMIVGSGSGEFTIASQGGGGPYGWSFVLWNGSVSAVQDGLPIAFSHGRPQSRGASSGERCGRGRHGLARDHGRPVDEYRGVVHRTWAFVSGAAAWARAYGFDAAFSPGGGYLLASGTLVNLSNGSTVTTGKGGWLPDGTLVTASNAGLLRWQGTHSSLDARFPGMGTVETSRHGELIYFYGNGRPAAPAGYGRVAGRSHLAGCSLDRSPAHLSQRASDRLRRPGHGRIVDHSRGSAPVRCDDSNTN